MHIPTTFSPASTPPGAGEFHPFKNALEDRTESATDYLQRM